MRYVLIAALLFAGCEPATETRTETFTPDDSEYRLAILIDMSGSFSQFMAKDGKAYEFLFDVIDTYFRDTIGTQNKVIIAQASGKLPFLLYEGTPQQLREQFNPQTFGAMLADYSDPDGSPVHEAVAKTVEYLMDDSSVASGKSKPILFILSDMDDNFPKTPELKERILHDLKEYGKLGGAFGIYYCDQDRVAPWKKVLKEAGITRSQVVAGFVAKPPLPSFD